jgi:hypothetical protein
MVKAIYLKGAKNISNLKWRGQEGVLVIFFSFSLISPNELSEVLE